MNSRKYVQRERLTDQRRRKGILAQQLQERNQGLINNTGEENSPFYTFFTHFVAVLGAQSWDNVGASHCTLGSLVIPHKLGLFTPICDSFPHFVGENY
jgi:hypothetical protein